MYQGEKKVGKAIEVSRQKKKKGGTRKHPEGRNVLELYTITRPNIRSGVEMRRDPEQSH